MYLITVRILKNLHTQHDHSHATGRASAKVDSRFCPRTALGTDLSGHNQLTIAKGKARDSKGSNPNLEMQSRRERRRHG